MDGSLMTVFTGLKRLRIQVQTGAGQSRVTGWRERAESLISGLIIDEDRGSYLKP